MADIDPRLLWILNVAANEWGALGVALAAAEQSSPQAVMRRLAAMYPMPAESLTPSADVVAVRDEDPAWSASLAACYPEPETSDD